VVDLDVGLAEDGEEVPAPVCLSRSSLIERSGFMRTSSTGSFPNLRSSAVTAQPPLASGRPYGAVSGLAASKAEPADQQQVEPDALDGFLGGLADVIGAYGAVFRPKRDRDLARLTVGVEDTDDPAILEQQLLIAVARDRDIPSWMSGFCGYHGA
jgi:hypothetical protein